MNKSKVLFLMIFLSLAFSSQSFSATLSNETSPGPGATLTVDGDIPLNLNFSPSVAGMYNTVGTTGNEQWYSVATYHSGGALFYGSGSDQTSVFKRSRATNQQFGAADVPDAPVLDADGNPAPWVATDANGDPVTENDWYR